MRRVLLVGRGDEADIFYKSGFDTDATCIFIQDEDGQRLYVPGFEFARAKKTPQRIQIEKLTKGKEIFSQLKGEYDTSWNLPYGIASKINAKLTPKKQVWEQRLVKENEEVSMIASAQQQAAEAIELVIQQVRKATQEGREITSEQLHQIARNHLIKHGLDCPNLIISSGDDTSHPHERGTGPIVDGPVIIDIFPQSSKTRYHGDMTRTIIVGDHPRAEKMLNAVKQVHDLCVEQCVPGKSASKLYQFAIDELEKRGFETNQHQGMIHSLGHGVGLEVHEAPNIGPQTEDKLKEGMVVAIEPGLYIDGIGVRHENIVVVGKKPILLR